MNYQKIENPDFKYTIHLMYALALLMFLVTILLGIARSLNTIQFSTLGIILVHLQAGTIGWIGIAIIATSFWIFFSKNTEKTTSTHNLTLFMKLNTVLLVLFVFSFYVGSIYHISFLILIFSFGIFIMTVGTLLLCGKQIKNTTLFTSYQFLILLGLSAYLYGNIFGSILAYQLVNGYSILIGDNSGLFTTYIEMGYSIIIITGLIEWQLTNNSKNRISIMVLLQGVTFLGFPIFFSLGLVFSNHILVISALLLEIVGLFIFFSRMGPKLLNIDIRTGKTDRYLAIASIFLVINLLLFILFVLELINDTSLSSLNVLNLLLALNHTLALGVTTNVLFAIITINVFYEEGLIPIIENIILIGFNGCLWLFLIAILIESSITIAAYMGLFLLIAVLILLYKIGIIYYKPNQV